ncbi:diguanylate cyclase [Photobacterium marinum]|uniref:Diguanylate cyclase n=2 Tax=Photobacterium marinum TaxID=1056511 RepID=L8J7S6_9GAMM|nr:diguanylate cyclase [Photobacterium marinum]
MTKWANRLPLNMRLTIAVMSFIMLAFITIKFITHQVYLSIEQEHLISRTKVLANGVGRNLDAAILFNDRIEATEILSAFKADPLIARVELNTLNQQKFSQYKNEKITFIFPSKDEETKLAQQSYVFGSQMLYMFVPIDMKGEQIGQLRIAVSLIALKQMQFNHFKLSLLLMIGLFLLSSVFIYLMFSWLLADKSSEEKIEQLEYLATHDMLTELPNRSKLHTELTQQLTQLKNTHSQMAVLFIDLDDFKSVNDSHDHQTGDKALKVIAERLRHTLRDSDIIARLAGDEFVAVLNPVKSAEDARQTSARLLSKIREPLHLGKLQLQLNASIGCYYVSADNALDAEEVIKQADEAMYDAKLSGKGQISEYNQFN